MLIHYTPYSLVKNKTFLPRYTKANRFAATHESVSFNKGKPPKPIERYTLLRPIPEHSWERIAVGNSGVARLPDGNILLLYRADGKHTPESADNYQHLLHSPGYQYIQAEGLHKYASDRCSIGMALLDPEGRKVLARKAEPVLSPLKKELSQFHSGFEDARITKIRDTYFINLVGFNNPERVESFKRIGSGALDKPIKGAYIYLVKTKDFKHFERVGDIGPDAYERNSFFHTEPISVNKEKHYLLFHRLKTDIQYALAKDMNAFKNKCFWEKEILNRPVRTWLKAQFPWEGFEPHKSDWPGQIAGAAAPLPITINPHSRKLIQGFNLGLNTQKAWLFLYNAAGPIRTMKLSNGDSKDLPAGRRIGACILSINDHLHSSEQSPIRVIARSPYPILQPETYEEKRGRLQKNVVFSCGFLPTRDKRYLDIFYSSGDSCVSKSRFHLKALCDYILQYDENGDLVR